MSDTDTAFQQDDGESERTSADLFKDSPGGIPPIPLGDMSQRDFEAWREGKPLPELEAKRAESAKVSEARLEAKLLRQRLEDHEISETAMQRLDFGIAKDKAVARGMEKYPDFAERVSEIPITEATAFQIARVKNGEDVAYHLASHPSLALEFSEMDPSEAAVAVADLSKKMDEARRPTRAPAPLKTVKSSSVTPRKSPSDMSQREFEQWADAGYPQ